MYKAAYFAPFKSHFDPLDQIIEALVSQIYEQNSQFEEEIRSV